MHLETEQIVAVVPGDVVEHAVAADPDLRRRSGGRENHVEQVTAPWFDGLAHHDQPANLDGQTGLLLQFAYRRGFGVFTELDAAAGQRPRAGRLGDVRQPAEQQAIVVVDAHVVRRDSLYARTPAVVVGRAHSPVNAASRLSRNAAMPSTRSGDEVASAWK